jgi:hypothetical protein
MQEFIAKYQDRILGTLSGFDRVIFRGSLRRLHFGWWDQKRQARVALGMEQYLGQNKVLFKDYREHVTKVSEAIQERSVGPFREKGLPVEFVRSPKIDQEEMARGMAQRHGIASGPVCVLAAMELTPTFSHRGTHRVMDIRPCQVLYHYHIHPEVGWMHARIQTWFPFHVQIGINGREWLARQMQRAGLGYRQEGNCFVWIEDYARAQELMNQQLETNWAELLGAVGESLNPLHEEIFARYETRYYWTCYQSEWATDLVFREAADLRRLMPKFLRHGLLTYSSADVLRYFSKPVKRNGEVPENFRGNVQVDLKEKRLGERIQYWMNGNSLKTYDKAYSEVGSVLRGAETTINQVKGMRVDRRKEGGPEEDLAWRPLRKGVADLHRRAEISQRANERLLNALASVVDNRTLEELTAPWQRPVVWQERRVRALRPLGEDRALLGAVMHGDFLVNGFRNRDLQTLLYAQPTTEIQERRRRSAAISRKLRMLRAHGLIRKVPHTHRYHVTEKARPALATLLTAARSTINQLDKAA